MKHKNESEGGKGSRTVEIQTLATGTGRQLHGRCRESLSLPNIVPGVFYWVGLNCEDMGYWEGHNPKSILL